MAIQAVIFDVGGVLIRTEDRSQRAALERQYGLRPGEADELVFNSEAGLRAQQGAITTGELWRWVQERLGLDDQALRAFQRAFWAGDRLDEALVAFIRRLKPRYQTAIISNATDNLLEVVRERYPMADAFDVIVGSAYEGIMKPDPAIFRRTLERLGREPAEAVFIDDFPHNVAGARAVGMHAIHFTPGMDLPQALAALGVRPAEP